MSMAPFKFALILFTVVTSIVSCGGGGGGSSSSSGSGGIGGTGVRSTTASGKITGFGSIFVNGIEFETNSATVVIDGQTLTESDLKLGMVVKVNGSVNDDDVTGTASTVEFDDDVQGPIDSITLNGDGTKTLTVLGFDVIVTPSATIYDSTSFDTLATNDVIEVSGFADSTGTIQASRIEKKETFTPGTSEIEIKGDVSGLSGTTFTLGSYSVDFAAADLGDVPGGTLANGDAVEVKGTLVGTDITATKISLEDDLFGSDEDNVSVEGYITNYSGLSNFTVNGQRVDASSATLEPSTFMLGNDVKVELEGRIVSGVLVATTVEARKGDIELEALVQSVSGNTITLMFATGTLDVSLDTSTQLEDDLGIFDPYTVSDITAGDFLAIHARFGDLSSLIATEIQRKTQDNDVLQGPVDYCTTTQISVLGLVYVLTNGVTNYEDENEASVADNTTFCGLVNGSSLYVSIEDNLPTPEGVADKAKLED